MRFVSCNIGSGLSNPKLMLGPQFCQSMKLTRKTEKNPQVLSCSRDHPLPIGVTLWKRFVELLAETGQPMHYQQIYETLTERGMAIGGKRPSNTLLSRFYNDPRLERVGQGYLHR